MDLEKVLSGTSDPRANGSERTTDDLGRILIGKTNELGQNERLATLGTGAHEQILHDAAFDGKRNRRVRHRLQPLHETPLPSQISDVVGAHSPGNGEHPGLHARFATKRTESPHHPKESLLGEVRGIARRTQGRAKTPHPRLKCSDELGEKHVVPLLPSQEALQESFVLPHAESLARRFDFRELSERIERLLNSMSADDDETRTGFLRHPKTSECSLVREAVSARLDNEETGSDPAPIEEHLSQCPDCRSFLEFSTSLKRAGIREAPLMKDIAPLVLKQFRVGALKGKWSIARGVLAVCAVEVIIFSMLDLFGGTHASRHLGSFSVAFGVVLLSVVLRPTRARLMMPVAGVLALSLVITAVFDMINGNIPLVTEARHIPEIISVAMIWLLAQPQYTRSRRTNRSVGWTPSVVERKRESA
ncbi:MAG: hypothetical protein RIU67_1104 [Actinomycetota bacterium]